MSDGFLDTSDFQEPLELQSSVDEPNHCFFDVQHNKGICLGLRSFFASSGKESQSLFAVDQMCLRFTTHETTAAYMEKEAERIASFGEPFRIIQAPELLPPCKSMVTAARLDVGTDSKNSFSFYCSIEDNLHIIRLVLTFYVQGQDFPTEAIEDILRAAVRNSRNSRRLGY